MHEIVIKTSHLNYRSGSQFILRDINLEIRSGEHWLIFGLNGSGKTTLTNILSGYGHVSGGELSVFGDSYTEENVLEKRKQIGYVSSSFFDRYYQHEDVLDIVLSGLTGTLHRDFSCTTDEMKRALALLEALGIAEKRYLPFSRLSKGQRQNVLIARALISRPKILILDEPATGLDVLNRELLLATIRDLAQHTNMTILYITHYTEEILEEFDHCLLLRNGQIYRTGATAELFQTEFFSHFLDYPVTLGTDSERLHLSLTVPSTIRTLLNCGKE